MKAVILKKFGGIENFEWGDLEMPAVNDDEILVRIKATAFNPIDYQMRNGSSESKLLKSSILGRELSGEVVGLGKEIRSFAIGDKVSAYVGSLASNGTYTEFISIPALLAAKNPPNITFEQASAIPLAGMTALQCYKRLNLSGGKPVLITGGAGGVGTILIKLLLANGHKNIYTTAGNTESIRHLKQIGLPEANIVDYTKEPLIPSLRSASGASHFDYVIDLVGNKISEVGAELLQVFGTYFNVTYLTTNKANELLFDKAATIINVANYAATYLEGQDRFSYYGILLKELFDKFEKNTISPPEVDVIGSLCVETVQNAHTLMETNQTKGKKLVMTIS